MNNRKNNEFFSKNIYNEYGLNNTIYRLSQHILEGQSIFIECSALKKNNRIKFVNKNISNEIELINTIKELNTHVLEGQSIFVECTALKEKT